MTEEQFLAEMRTAFDDESFQDPLQASSWFLRLVAQLLQQYGLGSKDEIRRAAEKFWDEVVVPFDLPKIPNWLEPTVERALKPIVMAQVDVLADKLQELLNVDNGGDTTDGGITAG